MKQLRMFILTKTTQGLPLVVLKAWLDAHVSPCGFCGSEERQQNKRSISGTIWYFIHLSLWLFEIKKNFSDLFSWHEEYWWQILDTKITTVEFGGPSSTAFIKVASKKRTKNRFRNKVICMQKTNIVLPSEFEVLNFEILCHKMHWQGSYCSLQTLKENYQTIPQ